MRKIFIHFTTFNFHTFSPGTRNVLLNPEDRKGLTMDFDRVRGFKLWYTFWAEVYNPEESNFPWYE